MGLFDALGDMAREKYEGFRDDPEGTISRAVSNSVDHMNKRYEEKKEGIIRTAERKARTLSDEQLDRLEREGNEFGSEAARREKDRRGI
jgi:vacuolar-type H+-ATPase subunit H